MHFHFVLQFIAVCVAFTTASAKRIQKHHRSHPNRCDHIPPPPPTGSPVKFHTSPPKDGHSRWPSPSPAPPVPSCMSGNHPSQQQGSVSIVGESQSSSSVTYSGPDIVGQGSLPYSISTVIFPTAPSPQPFPHYGKGRLGQNNLPQSRTNGQSNLGTFDAPKLPPFVGSSQSGSNTQGAPWGDKTANGTNPYTSPPNTGVVRSYYFDVARGTLAPDGVQRDMVLVNGQFPGPTIEANWGDTIEITVTNSITGPEEGTSIHWHGLLQVHTGYEDGVPGVTQCPIAPGQTFTYRFQADLYGTSWWHSHFSAQYAGGALGAMVIHGPKNAEFDKDLGPVFLTDYYHDDYYTIVEDVMGTDLSKIVPFSQNNLINGKGNYDCSLIADNTTCTENAGLAKFEFTSGQTHRLRLINAGAEGIQRFSIDDHTMQVIAYDFVPIVPYRTDTVTLGVGQRADVLVTANGSSSQSYWMRSTISSLCSLSEQPTGLGIIYYQDANTTAEPTTTSWTIDDSHCGNDPLASTVPYYSITPPTTNKTVTVSLSFTLNSTGHFLWTVDGSSFRTDYNNPILPLLQSSSNSTANSNSSASSISDTITNFPTEWNTYDFGTSRSFTIVVKNDNPVTHPMHIHGHNMFILAEGTGTPPTSFSSLNPTRRDVQLIQPNGYIVLQVDADNPGVWPFHCHIAWHVSGGLYMNIVERPSEIKDVVKSLTEVDGLCDSWATWTDQAVVDQIDSGLKRDLSHNRHVHSHMHRHGHGLGLGLGQKSRGLRHRKFDHVRHSL